MVVFREQECWERDVLRTVFFTLSLSPIRNEQRKQNRFVSVRYSDTQAPKDSSLATTDRPTARRPSEFLYRNLDGTSRKSAQPRAVFKFFEQFSWISVTESERQIQIHVVASEFVVYMFMAHGIHTDA